MHGQYSSPVGPTLARRMDDHVHVTVTGEHADIGVRVELADCLHIPRINPGREQRPQRIV